MAVLPRKYSRVELAQIKHRRRTATSVLAGEIPRPKRYVLTSLLNGVPVNQVIESEQDKTKREKKKEKRERDRERKRQKAAAKREMRERETTSAEASTSSLPAAAVSAPPRLNVSGSVAAPVAQPSSTSSFWRARPAIHIASMQRSVSITPPPPPMPSSPASTPGPSISSSTSRTSSKRPYTPDDDDDDIIEVTSAPPKPKEPPRKRVAVKKGWKGWVEGSPPPSEKLINLDSVPVLQERKTRSGKAFDGIGDGKDWV